MAWSFRLPNLNKKRMSSATPVIILPQHPHLDIGHWLTMLDLPQYTGNIFFLFYRQLFVNDFWFVVVIEDVRGRLLSPHTRCDIFPEFHFHFRTMFHSIWKPTITLPTTIHLCISQKASKSSSAWRSSCTSVRRTSNSLGFGTRLIGRGLSPVWWRCVPNMNAVSTNCSFCG